MDSKRKAKGSLKIEETKVQISRDPYNNIFKGIYNIYQKEVLNTIDATTAILCCVKSQLTVGDGPFHDI